MSGVRVNLLPGDVERRNRETRQRLFVAIAFGLLVVLLVILYFVQLARVGAVEDRLAEEQAVLAALEADLATLTEFEELRARLETRSGLVAAALGPEGSLAGLLQDLGAVFPPDSQLDSLAITLQPVPVTPALGADRLSYGSVSATGQSLQGHAPGVERLLLDLEKVAVFDNVFIGSSVVDEEGISTFTFELDLGPEVRTERYVTGLPEDLR